LNVKAELEVPEDAWPFELLGAAVAELTGFADHW